MIADLARNVLEAEAAAIRNLIPLLGPGFDAAVDRILHCRGRVVVSGVGKTGFTARKFSATLASTGTPSIFLHPTEALHGDLGRVSEGDLALLMSASGETDEVLALIDPLRRIGTPILAMTGGMESRLATLSDLVLDTGRPGEACPLGLAPTSSNIAMLALGDALAMVVLDRRGFCREDYARYHPAGALGRKFLRVGDVMRQGDEHTVVPGDLAVRDVVIRMNSTRGRPGAASVVDASGRLAGFFTDGDLSRHLERGVAFLESLVGTLMTRDPKTITPDRLASEALGLLRHHRIDQVPVVDADGRPVGLVDVQDLLDARVL